MCVLVLWTEGKKLREKEITNMCIQFYVKTFDGEELGPVLPGCSLSGAFPNSCFHRDLVEDLDGEHTVVARERLAHYMDRVKNMLKLKTPHSRHKALRHLLAALESLDALCEYEYGHIICC